MFSSHEDIDAIVSLAMAKATLKTAPSSGVLGTLLDSIPDTQRRNDTEKVCALMQQITACAPVMWGASVVGFGSQTLHYESGRSVDWFVVGCSPRKAALTLYLHSTADVSDLMSKLGKHTTGKSCIYIKKLEQIDMSVLTELITRTWRAAV
jgi:hypothetical protein